MSDRQTLTVVRSGSVSLDGGYTCRQFSNDISVDVLGVITADYCPQQRAVTFNRMLGEALENARK